MNEDEAWEELEHRIWRRKVADYISLSKEEAQKFMQEANKTDLAMMTLTQAYELGYRHGYTNGKAT